MKKIIAILLLLVFVPVSRASQDKDAPVKVPFDVLRTQHMVVEVKVNGEGPFRLIFDTGAPVTLINNKVAKAAGLVDKNAKSNIAPLFPGMGQFKVKSLQFGDLEAKDVPVVVMDHPTVTLVSKILGPIEGIVGFSFFARYRMTIDYQAKEMTFVPTTFQPQDTMAKMLTLLTSSQDKKPKVVAPAGLWGFSVDKEKGDEEPGVTVKAVSPDSPAAKAGLKEGDRLLTLEGRWTDNVLDTYRAATTVRPGTTARLVIRRDGNEMELTVAVQSGT